MKPVLRRILALSLAAASLTACEGEALTDPALGPDPALSTDQAQIQVDAHGVEWHRVGPTKAALRRDPIRALTDADIAAIEDLDVERRAVDEGLLFETPSGQLVDPATGVFLTGAVLDDDSGEWVSPPLDPDRVAELLAAYDAAHGPEPLGEADFESEGRPKSVFGSDDRIRKTTAEREDFPFSAVLEYTIPMSDAACAAEGAPPGCALLCTASLISAQYAATAAHCVYSRSDNGWIYGNRTLANGRDDRGQLCRNNTCVNVHSRWRSSDYDNGLVADFTEDYALLKLDNNMTGHNGTFTMSSLTDGGTIKAKRHYNYGYPGDGNPYGLWGMGCDIDYTGDQRLGYKCDTSEGHSGGPVYYRNGDTRYQTGIHAGRAVTYNTGPMMGHIRGWMLSKM